MLDYFPTPLADTLDDAVAESSARAQRDKVVETFRVAVRLLAILALAGSPGPSEVSGQVAELLRKMLRQGLTDGEWVALARELLRPHANRPEAFPIAELVRAFFEAGGRPTAVFAQNGACDSLLAMRKSDTVAHGVSGTEETAQDVLAARVPDLEVFLRKLEWLRALALVVPLSRGTRADASAEYSVLRLAGVTPRRGFRPERLSVRGDLVLGRVYAVLQPDKAPLELHPLVQHAEAASGQAEVFLFEEADRRQVSLRTYPTGQRRSDSEALAWLKGRWAPDRVAGAAVSAGPPVTWTLDALREAARRASDDYLDRMQRERIYVPHLYARRLDLEVHLSSMLDPQCTKTGMLVVGTSGIGKTNTLCHIVRSWRGDPTKLGTDVVLFMGGSTVPGGTFSLRDVILDRLELTDSFPAFLSAFGGLRKRDRVQFVVIVDGVDKHPQPSELLRQLDDLVVRSEGLGWLKVMISIGEVVYRSIRKGGFVPAERGYYTVTVQRGASSRESAEVVLGPLTDDELADAYERYRAEPGLSPTSPFSSLTMDVKNAMRSPLYLRIVMEVFNGRQIPRRTLTAEVMLEYCSKKIFSDPSRAFFVHRFVDLLYDRRWTAARLDALLESSDLRPAVLDSSPQSAFVQLLDEQVLEEQLKRVSATSPLR